MEALLKYFLIIISVFAVNVQAGSRTALVIGNSDYERFSSLVNPTNDAQDIANKLEGLGFKVSLVEDADQKEMRNAIREFGDDLQQNGGVGLFYYAGHGVQVNNENYLLPLHTDIKVAHEVMDQAIKANYVLRLMEDAGNPLNIVILDACRNNPFPSTSRGVSNGLARMESASGTLIAYSTGPGFVASDGKGRNSPYAEHLLKYISQPRLSIEQVFKRVRQGVEDETEGAQTPWETSSLKGDFYFVSPPEKDELTKQILQSTKMEVVSGIKPESKDTSRNLSENARQLIIYTNPSDATVRLVNIDQPYRSGMLLEPSSYMVEINREGFLSKKQWIVIDKDNVNIQITLIPEDY